MYWTENTVEFNDKIPLWKSWTSAQASGDKFVRQTGCVRQNKSREERKTRDCIFNIDVGDQECIEKKGIKTDGVTEEQSDIFMIFIFQMLLQKLKHIF